MNTEEPIATRIVKIKSLNLKNVELKVTLSALCNTLGLKPKEMQDGLMSAIDTTKKHSYVEIKCYKDKPAEFIPKELPISKKLKELHTQLTENSISEEQFQKELVDLAKQSLQKREKINILDINKIVSQFKSTIKSFR